METRKISDLTIFEQRVLNQAFKLKFADHGKVTDFVLEQNPDIPEVKNVCAKLHVSLSNRLDDVSSSLGMSKREFIEIALIEAMNKADSIIDEVDPFNGFEGGE